MLVWGCPVAAPTAAAAVAMAVMPQDASISYRFGSGHRVHVSEPLVKALTAPLLRALKPVECDLYPVVANVQLACQIL